MNTRQYNDVVVADVQVATKGAATLVNGTTLFTISGGAILIESIVAICKTGNNGTASTLQFSADPTDGAPTTISGASASLASALAGATVVTVTGTLATAPAVYAAGVGIAGTVGIIVTEGIITSVVGVGSTTGTWEIVMRYKPLSNGVKVS